MRRRTVAVAVRRNRGRLSGRSSRSRIVGANERFAGCVNRDDASSPFRAFATAARSTPADGDRAQRGADRRLWREHPLVASAGPRPSAARGRRSARKHGAVGRDRYDPVAVRDRRHAYRHRADRRRVLPTTPLDSPVLKTVLGQFNAQSLSVSDILILDVRATR